MRDWIAALVLIVCGAGTIFWVRLVGLIWHPEMTQSELLRAYSLHFMLGIGLISAGILCFRQR